MNKIPITLGVVGHRFLDFTLEHKQPIKEIFLNISKKYPNSPITLFSQLAIGADTIVAELFLEVKKETNSDFRLIAPIPYDLEYFKKTQFKTAEQLNVFNNLLKQCERSFTINKLTKKTKAILDKNSDTDIKELNELYRLGGEFVADSAIILMALWEGVDNKLEGGTANTVAYKKTGSHLINISDHIFDKEGSLISILCNRTDTNFAIKIEDNYLETLLKDSSIVKALSKIEELNSALLELDPTALNESCSYLFPDQYALSENNVALKLIYSLVDTQANKHQIKYNTILKGLFLLGFVIFGVFESYKHLGLHQTLFFTTIALIAFAFGIFKISINWQNHNKYIEDRVLAEALRIQFFWNLAKIKGSVSKHILRIHKKEYYWLKHILLGVYGTTCPGDNSQKESISIIKEHWIDNQKKYFEKKVEALEKKEKHHKILSYAVFGIGMLLLVGIFILNFRDNHHPLLHPLIVLDSIVFGIFALIKAYYEKRGYEQTKTQYSLMQSIYIASSNKITEIDLLNNKNECEEIDNILSLTGKEAVVENGNWYMIYKDKEPEVEGIG
ncbi:hypothetical protein [uncultured Lutibacter sp.]|uniref:hypothetical protein n=1 Tax=uncultured Lutibacter sp. TaxID=437739 RepID=UPI00261FC979|nr:hypothetical protein [uncultured Lutibacter sp.]